MEELTLSVSSKVPSKGSHDDYYYFIFIFIFIRRQKEVVTPTLFDIAVNGDKDKLYQLLENGDDVNPIVSYNTDTDTLIH